MTLYPWWPPCPSTKNFPSQSWWAYPVPSFACSGGLNPTATDNAAVVARSIVGAARLLEGTLKHRILLMGVWLETRAGVYTVSGMVNAKSGRWISAGRVRTGGSTPADAVISSLCLNIQRGIHLILYCKWATFPSLEFDPTLHLPVSVQVQCKNLFLLNGQMLVSSVTGFYYLFQHCLQLCFKLPQSPIAKGCCIN